MNSTGPGGLLAFRKGFPQSRRGSNHNVRQAYCAFDIFAIGPNVERREPWLVTDKLTLDERNASPTIT